MSDIDEAETLLPAHGLPFNHAGWEITVNEYGGLLPVEISALPEGMVTPIGTALVQVHNADPRLFWLTSYLETALVARCLVSHHCGYGVMAGYTNHPPVSGCHL